MTNRGGRPKLHGIDEYFRPASEEGFTLNRVVCKLCSKTMAKHTSKQLRHLHTQCTAYRQLHEVIPSRQPLINTKLDSVSKASKDALDRQAAVAVFTSGKPYSLYEEPETLKLFEVASLGVLAKKRTRSRCTGVWTSCTRTGNFGVIGTSSPTNTNAHQTVCAYIIPPTPFRSHQIVLGST